MAAVLLALGAGQADANLLRNGTFQDDWLTLLPENQNHHWCYGTGFQNRRDYNPDAWFFSGSWKWLNADGPPGTRRVVLEGPRSEVYQRVNWVFVHDDRRRDGFPDAGGFPTPVVQRSLKPLALVRDLTLRLRVRGENVPAEAASAELGLAPPGGIVAGDPLGALTKATVAVSTSLPSGTFPWRWVEVPLPAAQWLNTARTSASEGTALPGVVSIAIRYTGASGHIEIERAELEAADPSAPNLLPPGDFEATVAGDWPEGWSRPEKYRYFPGALYYLFNTWHNGPAENRGVVARDTLIPHRGSASLKMIVPSGDEVQVLSAPIALNQTEARLIEVSAWIRTDQLNMLQIDGMSESGERLDGFNFIHKAPVSIGTDGWRLLRQVFRPRRAVRSLRVVLAARGVNGYTLGDTGSTPQANATGTIWWDDVRVFEPESTAAELSARGVRMSPAASTSPARRTPFLENLDVGERRFGTNRMNAVVVNAGPARRMSLLWRFTTPQGRTFEQRSSYRAFAAGEKATLSLRYVLPPTLLAAYTEHKGTVSLVEGDGRTLGSSEVWFSTWSTPIDLELGSLYLAPEQKQFVRLNLGFTAETMASMARVRLDVIRRRSGEILSSRTIAAGPEAVLGQRLRIPVELREDFTNLLLADLDVSSLPVQPYAQPERQWLIRATVLDRNGSEVFAALSQPFCRQARVGAQSGVSSVRIGRGNLLRVNDEPFLPWAAVYGHVPVYDGSSGEDASRYLDLRALPPWSIYDGFTSKGYTRAAGGFNSTRYVASSITDRKALEKAWTDGNLLASSVFVTPGPVYSVEDLAKASGGRPAMNASLAFIRTAPMAVSVAPGIEEAFGLFHLITKAEITGLRSVVDEIRAATGKPVMVGHGGYWNRFEFERVPFFDIYDPETEPLYPANLHTDLMPLIAGQEKTAWLRPQMYEDVPYERWRFHAYVELMRGARGFQIAHGPGDASLFRGLGGELEGLKPALWSEDPGPPLRITPQIEHWTRRANGRTYIMAATTRGLTFGRWKWGGETPGPHGCTRVTEGETVVRDEANSYGVGEPPPRGPSMHGIQYIPNPRVHGAGSRLVQWVWLDPKVPPRNLAVLVKADGRFTHAAAWGEFDLGRFRSGPGLDWFLRAFYRHANGFLGWGKELLASSLPYVPDRVRAMGERPGTGEWIRLSIDLSDLGIVDQLVDGVGFVHDGGRVLWGRTIVEDGDDVHIIWGDAVGPAPKDLGAVRIEVPGLKEGTRIKVGFEDRDLVAGPGYFIDDFRGEDLYQRFGGGFGPGYGDEPVAFHLYEIKDPGTP